MLELLENKKIFKWQWFFIHILRSLHLEIHYGNYKSLQKAAVSFPRHKGRWPPKTVPATYQQTETITGSDHKSTL